MPDPSRPPDPAQQPQPPLTPPPEYGSTHEHEIAVEMRKGLPPGFRARRGLNWGMLGLTYASYYLNRYNLSFAAPFFTKDFGFSNAEYGLINSCRAWAYAVGQLVNGLLADKIGGRVSMAIGGYGTALLNLLFALGAYHKVMGPFFGALGWFVGLRAIDGYLQAFGAPGFIKINTAWFASIEYGRFAGIFGFMINIGRFGIIWLAPAVLAGFTIANWHVPAGSWQWVFFIPAAIVTLITTLMVLISRDTPEQAGYHTAIAREAIDGTSDEPLPMRVVFHTIVRNPLIWLCAGAYMSTGVVRYAVDDWFPKYFVQERGVDMKSATFVTIAFMIPLVATLGSLASGFISDLVFKGRRAPVAAAIYFLETAIILVGTQATTTWGVGITLILAAFTCNATHSILGSAAAMDLGGRRMAGFASGVIDSFQYFGAGLAGVVLGTLIDKFGWGAWLFFMAGFGLLGGVLMLIMRPVELRIRAGTLKGQPQNPKA